MKYAITVASTVASLWFCTWVVGHFGTANTSTLVGWTIGAGIYVVGRAWVIRKRQTRKKKEHVQ